MIISQKILFLDIDGTILNREYDTNKKVWQMLNELADQGIIISIITSRPFAFSWHILKHLQNSTYHIFDRGSYISNADEYAMSVTIANKVINDIYKTIESYIKDIRIGFSKGKYFYANDKYIYEIQGYLETDYFENLESMKDFEGINSIWIRDLPVKLLAYINKSIPNNLSVRVISSKEKDSVDIFVNSDIAQKETFIKYLASLNNTCLDKSIAIGDSIEDVVFMNKAKYIYCPGNSSQEVKNISNYVAKKNYSEGVIEILEIIKSPNGL